MGIISAASQCLIEHDFIGTDATGTLDRGNLAGVALDGGGCRVAANVISGNSGVGVELSGADSSNNVVVGNMIGANATGTATIPNDQHAVLLSNGSARNRIGGAEKVIATSSSVPVASEYGSIRVRIT